MAKFFIHRPIFAIVIALIITLVGILAAFQLPIAQYPKISPPTISVSTTYTGANAGVVNETIAQVIEQQVNGTDGMDYMSSNSDDTGSAPMATWTRLKFKTTLPLQIQACPRTFNGRASPLARRRTKWLCFWQCIRPTEVTTAHL